MRALTAAIGLTLALAGSASAIECEEWTRLGPGDKPETVRQLIDARLASDVGQRYTSANRVAMRACAQRFVPRIVAEFDGACAEGISAGMNALDEIFDRYFLSCVQ